MLLRRTFILGMLLIMINTSVEIASAAALSRVQTLNVKRAIRLSARLLRWQTVCSRTEEPRCIAIRTRLLALQQSSDKPDQPNKPNKPSSKPLNLKTSKPPRPTPNAPLPTHLLPNQLFTPTNPLPVITVSNKFLLLGEQGKVIGTIELNPRDEPVEVRGVKIFLTDEVGSLSSIEVIDEYGFPLGTAALDIASSSSRNVFTLSLSSKNAYFIDQDDEVVFAFRPRLKNDAQGGVSGETAQISRVEVTATGRWSSNDVLVETAGPDFRVHHTALTAPKTIERAGDESGIFSVGTERKLGAFRFSTFETSNTNSEPRLLSLVFSINKPSDVTVTSAILRETDGGTSMSCSIADLEITCSSIPSSIGSIESTRKLELFADVSIAVGSTNPFLSVEVNRAGGPSTAGDLTWTDGETTFTWVPFEQPVVRGTVWR